jgi:hypothetical protein
MFDFPSVIKALTSIPRPVTTLIINQIERNPHYIQLLDKFGLNPTQPPKDPDGIYAYAFVAYGASKPEPILNFFWEKEIKDAFWGAFSSGDIPSFREHAKDFIARKGLSDRFSQETINIDAEIREFVNVYVKVTNRTRSPQDIVNLKFLRISDYSPIPDEFEALINEKVESFCGRKFVFDEIQQFIAAQPKGYFTVIGDGEKCYCS